MRRAGHPRSRRRGAAGRGVHARRRRSCPRNDFNRPTDIAFMCLGAFGQPGTDADGNPIETAPFTVSGRPMSVCHPPRRPIRPTRRRRSPTASIQNRTFAFVPNSASGDLSVIDADVWKMVDLNKATGGYGRVPLGTLPEQISTTTDGCRLMSANRGSCDLSLVDPSTLLAPVFAAQFNSATTGVDVTSARDGIQRIDRAAATARRSRRRRTRRCSCPRTPRRSTTLPGRGRDAGDAVARAGHLPVVRSGRAGRPAVGQHRRRPSRSPCSQRQRRAGAAGDHARLPVADCGRDRDPAR